MSQDQKGLPPEEITAQALVLKMLDSLDPKLPIASTVTFKVNRSKEEAFKKSVLRLAETTKKLPGVKGFAYQRQKPIQQAAESIDVVEYLIYQEWETVELFRRQFVSEQLKQFMFAVFDQVVAQPELKFYYDAEENIAMPQKPPPPPSLDEIRASVSKMLDGLDPKSPISATVVFKVKAEGEKTFNENAAVLAEATRKLPGCIVFEFQKHQPYQAETEESPEAVEYLIYEDWETVEQFRKQWDSQHLKEFQQSVFDLLSAPPDLTFYRGWRKPAGGVRLPKTGQTRCWDSKGNLIDCEGTGQDGDFQIGVASPSPRFIDNNNGTVTDNLTGLVWLKNANLFGELVREEAIGQASNLASGSCGLSDSSKKGDWRLPNVNELESILSLDNSFGPAVPADHPFVNLQCANYWSSTSVAAFPALGWYVAMAVGPPVFDLKFNLMRMWPVRGESHLIARTGQDECYDFPFGQVIDCKNTVQDGELRMGVPWPDPRFTDNADGTVTDHLTGLIWLKDGNAFGTQPWQEALDLCNSLSSGQCGLSDSSKKGDWRLPNINELRSLEDYGEHTPALAEGHPFVNVRHSLCWSSTTVASAPNLARFLFVGIGSCVWDHKKVLMGVWPVKGGL